MLNPPINLTKVNLNPLTRNKHLQELIVRAILAYKSKNEEEYQKWWHKYSSTRLTNRHWVFINYLKQILDRQAEYSTCFNLGAWGTRHFLDRDTNGFYICNGNQQTIIYDFVFDRILFCTVAEYETELLRLQELSEQMWDFILEDNISWWQWIDSERENYLGLRKREVRLPARSYYPFAVLHKDRDLHLVYGEDTIMLDKNKSFRLGHLYREIDEVETRNRLLNTYDRLIDDLFHPKYLDSVEVFEVEDNQLIRKKGAIVHIYPNKGDWCEVEIFDESYKSQGVITAPSWKIYRV